MSNPIQVRAGDGGVEEKTVTTSADSAAGGGGFSALFEAGSREPGVIAPGDIQPHRNISRGRLVWRRFRRKKLAIVGLVGLVLIAVLAWVGPLLTHWKVDDLDPDYTH